MFWWLTLNRNITFVCSQENWPGTFLRELSNKVFVSCVNLASTGMKSPGYFLLPLGPMYLIMQTTILCIKFGCSFRTVWKGESQTAQPSLPSKERKRKCISTSRRRKDWERWVCIVCLYMCVCMHFQHQLYTSPDNSHLYILAWLVNSPS